MLFGVYIYIYIHMYMLHPKRLKLSSHRCLYLNVSSIGNLVNARQVYLLPPIRLSTKGATSRVNRSAKSVGRPQGLERFQSMPGIQSHVVFPERFANRNEAILLGDDNLGYCLPRILLLIPRSSGILDRLLIEVL